MAKTIHRESFKRAGRYWRDLAVQNWTIGQRDGLDYGWAALYLCGYSIECGLKVLVCYHNGDVQTITEAMNRIGPSCPDLLGGGSGHHLRTLIRYAGVNQTIVRELDRQTVNMALDGWDVTWRYELPREQRDMTGRNTMWRALDSVSEWIVRKL